MALERQLQVKGDEALELQQRIVGLEVSRDESRADAEAQRAKLTELTSSRVRETDAALQSLEGKVRQTEEQLLVQTKVCLFRTATHHHCLCLCLLPVVACRV